MITAHRRPRRADGPPPRPNALASASWPGQGGHFDAWRNRMWLDTWI